MAVRDMVARHTKYEETGDFIPTPPFVTRVLLDLVLPDVIGGGRKPGYGSMVAWDPCVGQGHMSLPLVEAGFKKVLASDVNVKSQAYPECPTPFEMDYIGPRAHDMPPADLVVMNPPYKHLEAFIHAGRWDSKTATAVLCRVQALEGQGRYDSLFRDTPPHTIAFFSDRIPFKTGVVVRKAAKMFFHIWAVWAKDPPQFTRAIWLPPTVQRDYEKDSDYARPPTVQAAAPAVHGEKA